MMQYPIIASLITFILLLAFLRTPLVRFALDQPNERSLHEKAIPRTGGLALMTGVLAALVLMSVEWVWVAAIGVLMTVSLADDIWRISARYRLLSHLFVSAMFVLQLVPDATVIMGVLLVIALAWMSNLYNFMDGSDGLAGGMAVFGFGFYALTAYLANDMEIALMASCVVAASIAFLCFNFHPARIFMGDAGSIPLGFMAGGLGIYGYTQGTWPYWFPVALFSPFIVDASVTLLKRALRGERISQAHRSHYYQRIIQMGSGHLKTALAAYVLMAGVGLSAFFCLYQSSIFTYVTLSLWALIYLGLMGWVDHRWTANQRG
jgi:UDP-GlcNAc:undecaprenyl-phosphate GlcNAc-1-phosphate transferase